MVDDDGRMTSSSGNMDMGNPEVLAAEKPEQVFGEKTAGTEGNFQAEAEKALISEGQTRIVKASAPEERAEVARKPISEEQARALLAQETVEVEQRMKNASTHRKKVLMLVIGAAIFLAVIGVAMWLIVGDRTLN